MNKDILLELLKNDVVPALGCTEPVCVALCVAYASELLNEKINMIEVETNSGIYKNGMSAGIPNFDKVGLDYAASLGACLKNPAKKLEILEDINDEIIKEANVLVDNHLVKVKYNPQELQLYVKCIIQTNNERSICIIKNAHTNVVYLEKNGQVLKQEDDKDKKTNSTIIDELKDMKIATIRQLVDSMNLSELEFLNDGIVMNDNLANYANNHQIGIGLAKSNHKEQKLLADDLISRVMLKVSSATENRLDGCPLATMSSAGAGTKGIAVIIPIHETALTINASKEQVLKALAFAHLLNRYINMHIGKLSPMCSCVMASSTATSAGITYLLGGNDQQISYAIRNMTGTVTGMICDGGKVGCALKVSTGSFAAIMSAINAINNVGLRVSDGICAASPEECIKNMARIGKEGMANVDQTIIDIMLNKGASDEVC